MKTKTKFIIALALLIVGVISAVFAQVFLSVSDVTITLTKTEKDILTNKGIENITINRLICSGIYCHIFLAKMNGNLFTVVPLTLPKNFTLFKSGELEPLVAIEVQKKLKAIANYNPNITRISGGKVIVTTGVTP